MPEEVRVCSKCHLELPLSDFVVSNNTKGYRRGCCRKCEAARVRAYYATNASYREKTKANSIKQAKAHPERAAVYQRRADLKSRFGLTMEQFDQLFVDQGSRCALCGDTSHGRKHNNGKTPRLNGGLSSNWPVDHCHKDGRVRGILCHKCNTRLGSYEALVDQIGEAKLLEYLSRPSPVLVLPVVPPPVDPRESARFVAELPPRYTRGQCTVCGEDQHAGGLCFKHYMRARRTGTTALSGPRGGVAHHKTSLTEDQASEIRASTEKGVDLARRFNVQPSVISSIRKGHTWKHLSETAA